MTNVPSDHKSARDWPSGVYDMLRMWDGIKLVSLRINWRQLIKILIEDFMIVSHGFNVPKSLIGS